MTLSTPGHQSAVAFVRGGLVAIVALLAPARVTALLEGLGAPGFSGAVVRLLLPVLGFAAAGAVGGASLGAGGRGVRAFSVGGLASGVMMSQVWPQLSGLTGHEPPASVALFAVVSWAAAFGAGGLVSAWVLRLRGGLRLAATCAIGGALGGLVFVLPSLLGPLGFREMSPLARLAVSTLSSIVGLLVPFGVEGAAAGRAVDGPA